MGAFRIGLDAVYQVCHLIPATPSPPRRRHAISHDTAAARIQLMIQHLTGCKLPYTQIGKPFKTTYDFAERMLRRRLDEMGRASDGDLNVYMVGGELSFFSEFKDAMLPFYG